jgi:hypothetical protein
MQFAATIAVVASVLVLAIQTRAVARQTRVANEVAGVEAFRATQFHWKHLFDVFIHHPELHAYYFDETTAAPSATDSVRLRILAEQHCDWLEVAYVTNKKLSAAVEKNTIGEWADYIASVVASSSVLRSMIRDNHGNWPSLDPVLSRNDASQATSAKGAS